MERGNVSSVGLENTITVDVNSIICRGVALQGAKGLEFPHFSDGE